VDFTPMGPHVTAQSLPALDRSGTAVLMAGNPSVIQLNYLDVMTRNLRITGCSHATRGDVRAVAELVARGSLQIDQLITHRFPLAAASEAMKTIMLRKDSPALVVLDVKSEHDAA
jgi:threonine dehydrogenase-like Zn-dependent dehydrogenase